MKEILIILLTAFFVSPIAFADTEADTDLQVYYNSNTGGEYADDPTADTDGDIVVGEALDILHDTEGADGDTVNTIDPDAVSDSNSTTDDPAIKIVLAVESELISVNNSVVNIQQRPFVYNGVTYIPLRSVVENIGGTVGYDGSQNLIYANYKNNSYSIKADDESIRVFYGVSFVPMRTVCDDLGIKLNWYNGIITICDGGYTLNESEIDNYKAQLGYEGYTDSFLIPRSVVDPYVTYSYEQMNYDIDLLHRMYPELIHDVHSIGQTSEGREIPAFTLGKGASTIVLCGSMHAREYIATNFLMYLTDTYALNYVNDVSRDGYSFRNALDNVSFLIIPMVNPDGINLVQNGFDSTLDPEYVKSMYTNSYGSRGWKATVTGVDLNNNFDLLWTPKGSAPAYAGYGGPYAASEPETRAMQNVIDNTDFKAFVSFHTQGQVVYWMDPNCNQELVEKFKPLADRICEETGFTEMPSDGTYGSSGYMTDYVRYYKEKPAMTIEMCPYIGDYPYPESDFDSVAYPLRNIGLILADLSQVL